MMKKRGVNTSVKNILFLRCILKQMGLCISSIDFIYDTNCHFLYDCTEMDYQRCCRRCDKIILTEYRISVFPVIIQGERKFFCILFRKISAKYGKVRDRYFDFMISSWYNEENYGYDRFMDMIK